MVLQQLKYRQAHNIGGVFARWVMPRSLFFVIILIIFYTVARAVPAEGESSLPLAGERLKNASALFEEKCSTCHNLEGEEDGTALDHRMNLTDREWFHGGEL